MTIKLMEYCAYWYDKINKIMHHSDLCQKCSLVSKAEKMVVKIFEWRLPDNENLINLINKRVTF